MSMKLLFLLIIISIMRKTTFNYIQYYFYSPWKMDLEEVILGVLEEAMRPVEEGEGAEEQMDEGHPEVDIVFDDVFW